MYSRVEFRVWGKGRCFSTKLLLAGFVMLQLLLSGLLLLPGFELGTLSRTFSGLIEGLYTL